MNKFLSIATIVIIAGFFSINLVVGPSTLESAPFYQPVSIVNQVSVTVNGGSVTAQQGGNWQFSFTATPSVNDYVQNWPTPLPTPQNQSAGYGAQGQLMASLTPTSSNFDYVMISNDRHWITDLFCDRANQSLGTPVTITTTAETTILGAGGTGVFNDLIELSIGLNGFSCTSGVLLIRSVTAGGAVLSIPFGTLAAVSNPSFYTRSFLPPYKQTTSNVNWTAQINSATAGSIIINSRGALKK